MDHSTLFVVNFVVVVVVVLVSCCMIWCGMVCNISKTRKSVSSDFQTPRSRLEKRGAADFFFNQLRSVWK